MKNKKKLLIIQPKLPYYRIAIFNGLTEKYEVTILHSGDLLNDAELYFKQLHSEIKKLGPFFYLKINLFKLCKDYDVVISEGNIRHLDRNLIIINPFRRFKWVNWGIGVSADYKKKYDSDKNMDFIRYFLSKKADSNVFYSDYPKRKYVNAGFEEKSLFVANNTTEVCYTTNVSFKKKQLLFIGTLYKQKKIYELLQSYLEVSNKISNSLPLIIIGNGAEYENIKKWIIDHEQENNIFLKGPIFNPKELEVYFRESFACISPGQAGLSVLTSMGYGTPFITKKEAITGGEIFNIKNNINGIIYEKDDELNNILFDIHYNKEKYITMGMEARRFYANNRSIGQMIDGISSAIEYALKK